MRRDEEHLRELLTDVEAILRRVPQNRTYQEESLLVDVTLKEEEELDPVLRAFLQVEHGQFSASTRLAKGMYQSKHWNFEDVIVERVASYPDLGELNAYGVCDSPEQWAEAVEVIQEVIAHPMRKFVASFVEIRKDQQSDGGWRWRKWGPYIGLQAAPTTEYLYDEPEVERVYTYHVYEIV